MRVALTAATAALLFLLLLSGSAQAQAKELTDRIDEAIRKESTRLRSELLDLIRRELAGGGAPAPVSELKKAVTFVTADLLRKHATYLASDELE